MSHRIDLLSGAAIIDKFVIVCINWKDEDLNDARDINVDTREQRDLHYIFYARPQSSGSETRMIYYGPEPTTPASDLPMGYKASGFQVEVSVIIQDSLGESTEFIFTIRVRFKK